MRAACKRTRQRIETRARNDAEMAAAVADDFDEFFMSPWSRQTWCSTSGAATELDYYSGVVAVEGTPTESDPIEGYKAVETGAGVSVLKQGQP